MAARFDPEKKKSGTPAASAALFKKPIAISSLQTKSIEELLLHHKEMKLSDPVKQRIKSIFRPTLMQDFLQAAIDANHRTVELILDFDPELLLVEPASVGVTEIESKKTWQKRLTERPLIMMQKLRRLAMIKTLTPYFEGFPSKDETSEIVKQWILPPLASVDEQKNQEEKNKKLQQEYIEKYFKPLKDAIKMDDTVKVKWGLNKETNHYEARIEDMKEETQAALRSFRKQLLPDTAIAIDDEVDTIQLQIAGRRAYETFYEEFKDNWNQRNVFAICGIGFTQSLSDPELGAIYCESHEDLVNSKKPLSALAMAHKLQNGYDFYRSSRDSLSGLGFSFHWGLANPSPTEMSHACGFLENYVKQTEQSLADIRDECSSGQSMLPRLSSRCNV